MGPVEKETQSPAVDIDQQARLSAERLTQLESSPYEAAYESVSTIQDLPAFATYLKSKGLEFDDSNEGFWSGVKEVAQFYVGRGLAGDDPTKNSLIILAASAPNAAFKQLTLDAGEKFTKERERTTGKKEYLFSKSDRDSYVEQLSEFNSLVRDYLAQNLDTNFLEFTHFLTESANRGVDPNQQAGKNINALVVGIRTELGLEQKASFAGLDWKRGTGTDDREGIDYFIEGVELDIKTSLWDISEVNPGSEKPWAVHKGIVIYYPYDNPKDYINNTFRVDPSIIESRALQIKNDIEDIRRYLHLSK